MADVHTIVPRGLSVRCPLCGVPPGFRCRRPGNPSESSSAGGCFPSPSEWTGKERGPHELRLLAEAPADAKWEPVSRRVVPLRRARRI